MFHVLIIKRIKDKSILFILLAAVDGVVSYSMRQGDRRGPDVEFTDLTYDGNVSDGQLSGGIGQLIDKEEGLVNFRLQHQTSGDVVGNTRRRSYEWVGWKSTDQSSSTSGIGGTISPLSPIVIRFTLDSVRRITGVRVHSSNVISRDVAVFRAAELHFEADSEDDIQQSVFFEHKRDVVSELPRYVVIPVPPGGRLARHVSLIMHFDLRWIMISEIHIDSGTCSLLICK